jgi:hypothetical protein
MGVRVVGFLAEKRGFYREYGKVENTPFFVLTDTLIMEGAYGYKFVFHRQFF